MSFLEKDQACCVPVLDLKLQYCSSILELFTNVFVSWTEILFLTTPFGRDSTVEIWLMRGCVLCS